jgi:hypothetical protein
MFGHKALSQRIISGVITDSTQTPVAGVNVFTLPDSVGTISDDNGWFSFQLKKSGELSLVFSHVRYERKVIHLDASSNYESLEVELQINSQVLEDVEVSSQTNSMGVNSVRISAEAIQMTPVPFNDISKMLATLPSVVSNNELSTTYSVRGGSYDENQVLVNGIPVYRPFLVRAGRQEGLSFINPDLISSVDFSAGGWESTYGDKMSSVLSTRYKKPVALHGSAMVSLLGASAHLEGETESQRLSYLVGARHKRSAYLLNTLDIDGTYRPAFTDVQSFLNFRLSERSDIEVLLALAANRYFVEPETSETTFGTFNKELRLNVAFDGSEQLNYNTYQAAVKFNHRWNEKLSVSVLTSMALSNEREYTDLEGGYRLCDVDKNLESDTFNECIFTRGVGTLYKYARNKLAARILDIQVISVYALNERHVISGSVEYANQYIRDILNEYEFIDSARYITVEDVVLAENVTNSNLIKGFAQHQIQLTNTHLSYGLRFNYNSFNSDFFMSPRLQISFQPGAQSPVSLRVGTGLYQQQPFYREYRTFEGEIIDKVLAQSAFHGITGMDYTFDWWHRPFIFTADAFYKYLWNIVPYTLENLRIRYYPEYQATGYAAGFEARIGGEFIPGTESWFSLGFLSTKEQIPGIDEQMVRRPTDQRFNMSILFEDHIPNDPSFRVNLSFNYGSGLPFGPLGDITKRNSFTGDEYLRLDIGFSKMFMFGDKKLETLKISAFINNLLDVKNAVTYTWIKDINNNQFAVPNNLTGRLFNVSVRAEF